MKNIILLSLGLMASACAHRPVSYVGLGEAKTSFVRVVAAKDQICPAVEVKTSSAPAQTLSLQKQKFGEASICEAVLPPDAREVKTPWGEIHIPQEVQKVAIIGDTGCRLRLTEKGGAFQNCDNENEWPFRKIVRAIAKDNPDVVVHLGDYHYREICADPARCKPFQNTVTYAYPGWAADFMDPASELMRTKPFIFVRGNHEDCHRAYEGFDKLLSPVGTSACVEDQDTQYVSFGSLLIVNFDMATVHDKPDEKNSPEYHRLKERYLKMLKTIRSRPEKEVWFISHKPIWGLVPIGGSVLPTNLNLQRAVTENPFPAQVTLAFAGHIHDFQLARGKHPVQLVVGESGTELDPVPERPQHTHNLENGVEVFSPTVKENQFGYALLERRPEGWQASLKNTEGKTEYICPLWRTQDLCVKVDSASR
jgi:hypothetical protein